jgi:predicted metal-dependent hydrolase
MTLDAAASLPAMRVRPVALAFDHRPAGLWNPRRPELSHMLNAFQLALPYLEPYFIDAIKEALPRIADPRVAAEAAAFCAQEANHARQHARYCRALRPRYPRLAEYEKAIQQSLVRSRQKDPLEWRLAFAAGYEAITAQLSRWMFARSRYFFEGADPVFATLMTWHAVEEIEHRHVAFEVLQAVDAGYALRAKGLFAALGKTKAEVLPVVTYMLEVDGYGGRLDSRARRFALRVELAGQLAAAVVRYLAPGHHPSKIREPQGVVAWRLDYEGGERVHGKLAS